MNISTLDNISLTDVIPSWVFAFLLGMVFMIFVFVLWNSRYIRCPRNKILVVYGRKLNDKGKSFECIAGGAAFVWPIIQDYAFLELTPIPFDVNLKSAPSKDNIMIRVSSNFTISISNEESIMDNAAERLLNLTNEHIESIARDIIFGQMRNVIATMSSEEININREKFNSEILQNVESEIKIVGLKLISFNIKRIETNS